MRAPWSKGCSCVVQELQQGGPKIPEKSSEERSVVNSVNWRAVASTPGCSVASAEVVPIAVTPLGIPKGIQLDSATIVGHCGGTNSQHSSTTLVATPLVVAICPNLTSYTGAPITNGYESVGTATINGNSDWVGAVYTYQGTISATGHEELGQIGSGCAPGNLVSNGSTTTLIPGDYQEVYYLRSSSAIWTATWWEGSSSYTNWGTVCGFF